MREEERLAEGERMLVENERMLHERMRIGGERPRMGDRRPPGDRAAGGERSGRRERDARHESESDTGDDRIVPHAVSLRPGARIVKRAAAANSPLTGSSSTSYFE